MTDSLNSSFALAERFGASMTDALRYRSRAFQASVWKGVCWDDTRAGIFGWRAGEGRGEMEGSEDIESCGEVEGMGEGSLWAIMT